MAGQGKRIPGDRNPEPSSEGISHVSRESMMANGHGSGDIGIARGISSLVEWRRRRKAIKARGNRA